MSFAEYSPHNFNWCHNNDRHSTGYDNLHLFLLYLRVALVCAKKSSETIRPYLFLNHSISVHNPVKTQILCSFMTVIIRLQHSTAPKLRNLLNYEFMLEEYLPIGQKIRKVLPIVGLLTLSQRILSCQVITFWTLTVCPYYQLNTDCNWQS